jgi:hypothetical protein
MGSIKILMEHLELLPDDHHGVNVYPTLNAERDVDERRCGIRTLSRMDQGNKQTCTFPLLECLYPSALRPRLPAFF